jgi:PAT family beta-lactamase induction signal transducer AmpG
MAATPPASALGAFALLAGLVAWLSASQDVVVDAYRTDLLAAPERGLGSSLAVLGYRLAMIVSGGIAFIWVDPRQGGGWTWPEVYRLMAFFMVGTAAFSALVVPRLVGAPKPASVARNDVVGFLAVAAAVALGFVVTRYAFAPAARTLIAPTLVAQGFTASLADRWADLVALFSASR